MIFFDRSSRLASLDRGRLSTELSSQTVRVSGGESGSLLQITAARCLFIKWLFSRLRIPATRLNRQHRLCHTIAPAGKFHNSGPESVPTHFLDGSCKERCYPPYCENITGHDGKLGLVICHTRCSLYDSRMI